MIHRSRQANGGFTLVELLVVLLLLGVVGSIVTGGLLRGMRADAQAQARIEAFEQMQIALERVSRDVRAASMPLIAAEDDEILLQLLRDGECLQYRYWVDGEDALRVSEERSTAECSTFSATGERVLVPDLEPGSTVFTFETDAYDDDGVRVEAATVSEVRFVTISFTRTLFEQRSVTVSTVVGLRNAP